MIAPKKALKNSESPNNKKDAVSRMIKPAKYLLISSLACIILKKNFIKMLTAKDTLIGLNVTLKYHNKMKNETKNDHEEKDISISSKIVF